MRVSSPSYNTTPTWSKETIPMTSLRALWKKITLSVGEVPQVWTKVTFFDHDWGNEILICNTTGWCILVSRLSIIMLYQTGAQLWDLKWTHTTFPDIVEVAGLKSSHWVWGLFKNQRFPRQVPCHFPWKWNNVLEVKLLHENHDSSAYWGPHVVSFQAGYKHVILFLFF